MLRARPRDLLAVVLTVSEAPVHDPYEAVGEGPERLGVGLASSTVAVIEGASPRRPRQAREGPLVAGIGEPGVAGEPGQDHPALAGGLRDRRGSRVVAPGSSIGVAGRIISALAEHPGAEHEAESGKTAEDLGVRVPLKSHFELGLEPLDLVVQATDQPHERGDNQPVGLLGGLGGAELLRAERPLNLLGPWLDRSAASRSAEDRRELGAREPPAERRRRCDVSTATASRELSLVPKASSACG